MFDASNRKDIRRAEKAARLDERQDREVLTNLLSTVAGRSWVLRRLLEPAHIFATTVNRDPILMGYAEGERNLGLQVFVEMVRTCPDQYIQMMKEKEQRDASRERDPTDPADGVADNGDDGADDGKPADGADQ